MVMIVAAGLTLILIKYYSSILLKIKCFPKKKRLHDLIVLICLPAEGDNQQLTQWPAICRNPPQSLIHESGFFRQHACVLQ